MVNRAAILPKRQAQIVVQDVQEYVPGDGEVLIENHAAASNPIDWKLQKWGVFLEDKDYPAVFGTDVAGRIAAVGPNVSKFKVGDRVTAILTYAIYKGLERGAFQDFSVAKEQQVAHIPDNISFAEAATIPLGLTSAVVSLYFDMKLERPQITEKGNKNETVLIWGGSSSVGLYAIQLAARSGYTVFASASPHNFELVRQAGASLVVNHADHAEVQSKLKGKGIKYVYDAIGTEESTKQCIDIVEPNGVLGSVLMNATGPAGLTVKGLNASHFYQPQNKDFADYFFKDFLPTALETGIIKPNPVEVVPGWLEGTQAMLDRHAKGVSGKKLVIVRP